MAVLAPKTVGKKERIVFSDFRTSFGVTPFGGLLARAVNEEAVKQSVKNLLLTSKGDRFFQPDLGADLYSSLFDSLDILTSISLKKSIQDTLARYEPRVKDVEIDISDETTKNMIGVTIRYTLTNNPEVQDVVLSLQRVR